MGQSSSRHRDSPLPPARPTRSATPNAVAGASSDLPPDSDSADVVSDSPTQPRSRRSSFRRSILKLVNPSRRVASNDMRRSRRNSRRWSVAPSSSTPTLAEPAPISSSDVSTAGPSTLDPHPADKGKQREMSLPEEEEVSGDTNLLPNLAQASPNPISPDTLPSIVEPSHAAAEAASEPQLVDNSPMEDPTSDLPSEVTPVQEGNEPSALPGTQRPSPPPRHFPPPGTLVVVQGIVHTTDVSRATSPPPDNNEPNSNLQPPSGLAAGSEQTRTRSRNRLSALLRPRSASSRPSSTVVTDPITVPSPPELESPPLSSSESSSDQSTPTDVTTPDVNENVDPSQQDQLPDTPPSSTENRVPSISSSSIDVLGTLLSVAAAATAASLLTGSSEPILSSGLAPPTSSSPESPLPTSSPSSASLPNLPPYHHPPPNNTVPDISAAGRAERMRQAWGTIRERLGLRPSAPPPDHATVNLDQNNPGGDTNPPSVLTGESLASATPDTRELMLAEMARAFNIGLGLNGLGGMAPAAPDATGTAEPDTAEGSTDSADAATPIAEGDPPPPSQPSHPTPPSGSIAMPPEGSFERFLVDLQIDLRAALTQAEGEPQPERHRQQPQQPELVQQGSPTLNAEHSSPNASASSSSTDSTSPQPRQSSDIPRSDPQEGSSLSDDSSYVDMPALHYVSDSDSELDEEEHDAREYDDDDDFHTAEHGPNHTSGESLHGQTRTTLPGTGRIDASGRINWWRLYRFPPIVSPRTDTTSASGPAPASPLNSGPSLPTTSPSLHTSGPTTISNSSTPTSSTEQQLLPTPTNDPTPPPATDPSPSRSPLNSVVPVIVVGLQSVNSEWRPDIPPPSQNEGVAFWGGSGPENTTNTAGENGDDDLDGWGGQHHVGPGANPNPDEGRGRGRGQGWHSRAANAIRNLRPGRRTADAGTITQAPIIAPGSRTFLIYVIGGYYPPDHSIVTGGSNILDSFEALLELADLLGQVKPPTATKEDIDKSGLAIIKASELSQHEKDGKVSSNCLDRCLICLDDYADDDDVRVMTCRHAFHKGCVDEWLQRGRNNCPACRSTGVSNDPQPMPAV